jgi:hypothetical protein
MANTQRKKGGVERVEGGGGEGGVVYIYIILEEGQRLLSWNLLKHYIKNVLLMMRFFNYNKISSNQYEPAIYCHILIPLPQKRHPFYTVGAQV